MRILATVKFNQGLAYVLGEDIKYTFYRLGDNIIYGTDGLFYTCYKYDTPSRNFQAFAGRKFDITLNTGEVINCRGQWWDGGYGELAKHLGLDFAHVTYNTIEELMKCYVYFAACIDRNALSELLSKETDLPYYLYYDYEKIINYDKMRTDFWKREDRWEHAKKNLISECKRLSSELKLLK
jgi:hypothetical protein